MEQVRDPKWPAIPKHLLGGVRITRNPRGFGSVEQVPGLEEQALDHRGLDRTLVVMIEYELALSVRQRDQTYRDAVMIRDRLFLVGLRCGRGDPLIVRLLDRTLDLLADLVLRCGPADAVTH